MKKTIYTLFTAALLAFACGCSDDDDTQKNVARDVVGEWHLTAWNQQTHDDFDVYVEFLTDGTFHIYQKVETSAYVRYSGDFSTNGSRMTGRYDSGEAWSTDYEYALSGDGSTLTMTKTGGTDESTFTKTAIPEEVRNVREVRSARPSELLWMF